MLCRKYFFNSYPLLQRINLIEFHGNYGEKIKKSLVVVPTQVDTFTDKIVDCSPWVRGLVFFQTGIMLLDSICSVDVTVRGAWHRDNVIAWRDQPPRRVAWLGGYASRLTYDVRRRTPTTLTLRKFHAMPCSSFAVKLTECAIWQLDRFFNL